MDKEEEDSGYRGSRDTSGEEVEWEMNWQCDGKSQHEDLPFSSSSPLQATPYGEGLSQAALVGGEEEKSQAVAVGRKEVPVVLFS